MIGIDVIQKVTLLCLLHHNVHASLGLQYFQHLDDVFVAKLVYTLDFPGQKFGKVILGSTLL